MKVAILGGSGYVGTYFTNLFNHNDIEHIVVSRSKVNYFEKDKLCKFIKKKGITFLINCAGYTGRPNVDACEDDKAAVLYSNAVLPGIINEVCEQCEIPWGHVSSGCIYNGLNDPDPHGVGYPGREEPWTEEDEPNFCFGKERYSWYSGTKALGEQILKDAKACYIWRLRIPFDSVDSPRNYLSKIQNYSTLLRAENSFSYMPEFVSACWTTVSKGAPYGIYNVTQPGSMSTKEVCNMLNETGITDREFAFFDNIDEFNKNVRTPRSNTVLDVSKICTYYQLTPIKQAMKQAMSLWEPLQL